MVIRTLAIMACCVPALALADASPAATTAAPAAGTAQLGKVEVKGTQPLVQTLQQMKAAINAPFTDDPKHYDDMVCRIENNEGFRAQGVLLDCGTQGWYSGRRHGQQQATNPLDAAAYSATLGHPWHVVRLLNHEQIAALRKLLGKLPASGRGMVEVIEDSQPAPPAPAIH